MENINTNEQQQQQPGKISDKLVELRTEWTAEVESLNAELKTLPKLNDLLNVIYIKRQKAVDLYYGMMGVMQKQNREYRAQYADMYNKLKAGQNGIRYTNDSAISVQIDAQLINKKEIIDELKIFTDFMWETIKSIDNLIYGLNTKVKIYEMMHGVKF